MRRTIGMIGTLVISISILITGMAGAMNFDAYIKEHTIDQPIPEQGRKAARERAEMRHLYDPHEDWPKPIDDETRIGIEGKDYICQNRTGQILDCEDYIVRLLKPPCPDPGPEKSFRIKMKGSTKSAPMLIPNIRIWPDRYPQIDEPLKPLCLDDKGHLLECDKIGDPGPEKNCVKPVFGGWLKDVPCDEPEKNCRWKIMAISIDNHLDDMESGGKKYGEWEPFGIEWNRGKVYLKRCE